MQLVFLEKNMNSLSTKAAEVCAFLDNIGVTYEIFSHFPAFTIEECERIEKIIGGRICKNLFLRTTSGSTRILLMMNGNKKFVTKEVSKKLGTSRLSFASGEEMEEYLNTSPGSLSITGLIYDKEKRVSLAIDKDVVSEEYICCHPCDNSATLKIKTDDITEKLLPFLGISPIYIEI